MYLYTSVPHFDKQREATGVVHIGVGFLRCSFPIIGIAKALNMERTKVIERTLHEQGRTVTWFATQLCCTRPNVYKIFRKENIDIHLLWRISYILGHDFFRDLSDSINTGSFPSVSK